MQKKALSKAIELDPQLWQAYYSRGLAYRYLGNHQQAIKDFNKGLELSPAYAVAFGCRGLDNPQQAIEDIKVAARLGYEKAQDFLRSKGIEW